MRYEFGAEGKPKRLYVIPQVKKEMVEGEERICIILDKSDEDKLPEILEKITTRYAAKTGKSCALSQIKRQEVIVKQPRIKQEVCFNLWDWQRNILKIAYELAYKELGPKYLDDPTGAKIRALLQKETSLYNLNRDDGVFYIIDVPCRVTHRRSLAELVLNFVERENENKEPPRRNLEHHIGRNCAKAHIEEDSEIV